MYSTELIAPLLETSKYFQTLKFLRTKCFPISLNDWLSARNENENMIAICHVIEQNILFVQIFPQI